MRVALLSANPPEANPYTNLLREGLISAGIEVQQVAEAGRQGLPSSVMDADLLHLHWLELWGRPPYLNLESLSSLGPPGRGLRRVLVPLLNRPAAYAWRRRRFLKRFLDRLAIYRAAGGRLVYTAHNLAQHEGEADQVEREGLARLLAQADAVHLHNESMASDLRSSFSDLPPLIILPHGHYVDAYPNQVGREEARRRLGIPARSFVYLFLGLIRPYKGLEELLPAFRALQDPGARLLVAGRSRPQDYAASLADRADSDPRVHWHPHFVPPIEVQQWMAAADIVVLPYRRVSTSGAALLAWSFGKPVVAPALAAFVELMTGNPCLGLMYSPDDPDGLMAALEQVQGVNWQAERDGILSWVGQFDWQQIGARLAALYRQVVDAPR